VKISIDISVLGLWVQCSCAILIAALFLLLGRGAVPGFHRLWTAGWWCLAIALASLGLGFAANAPLLLWNYQFFELLFVLTLWKGSRDLADKGFVGSRKAAAAVGAMALWSALWTFYVSSLPDRPDRYRLSVMFLGHALWMGIGYGAAALSAVSAARRNKGLGSWILAAALAFLSLLFLSYSPLTYRTLQQGGIGTEFMDYSTFLHVLLQFAAAFAMLLCRTEHDQRRLSAFNLGLASAHRELVNTYALLRDEAERDPLTDAYNRMAFRHFESEGVSRFQRGCVVLIDMDSLKAINDRHGHDAGDRAIRLLADAIRGLFRSEDPLFRWGGDEFLILLPNANLAETKLRLSRLNDLLEHSWDGPSPAPQASWGAQRFDSPGDFARALKKADSAMYEAKKEPLLRERA